MLVASAQLPCARCKYDLSGLGNVSVCPECGLAIGPEFVLCCVGVPRRVESRIWRRVAWGFIIVFGALFSQLWLLMLLKFGVLVPLTALTMLIVAAVAMFMTGRRSTRTTERLVFCWAGIGRASWGRRDSSVEVMEWPQAVSVEVQTVGAVWQRLRIFETREGGGRGRFFECGFRCEKRRGPWVEDSILALSRGEAMPVESPSEVHGSVTDDQAEHR
jgi:hypothetical protein